MKPSRRIQRGNANLLRLAAILDKVPAEQIMPDGKPAYDQEHYVHECGAPACALGWWARHGQTRQKWKKFGRWVSRVVSRKQFDRYRMSFYEHDRFGIAVVPYDGARLDFALNCAEAETLFGAEGCGNARNDPKRAAQYIRRFVAQRKYDMAGP